MRAFIAFDINKNTKKTLFETQSIIKQYSKKGAWVKEDNFHCTLKFLGNIDEKKVDDIGSILNNISKEYSPINVNLASVGYFNIRKEEYSVIWVGLGGEIERLIEIFDIIDSSMYNLGFPMERRPFTPHITLGRRVVLSKTFEETKKLANKNNNYSFELNNIVLMRSEENMGRRIYTPTKSYKLLKDHR